MVKEAKKTNFKLLLFLLDDKIVEIDQVFFFAKLYSEYFSGVLLLSVCIPLEIKQLCSKNALIN